MAQAFTRQGTRIVGYLESLERELVAHVMGEVLELIDPDHTLVSAHDALAEQAEQTAAGASAAHIEPMSDFDAVIATLGPLGQGAVAYTDPNFADEQSDPALQRLFPSGNREDAQAAAEFRRLTEPGLRSRKVRALAASIEMLGQGPTLLLDQPVGAPLENPDGEVLELSAEQAHDFLTALTDVRLVLGERIGLRTDEDATRLDELLDSPDQNMEDQAAVQIYDFLTWLQESLTLAMLPPA